MTRRRGLICICICAALVISGLTAQSSAARWFTCSETAPVKEFANSTCTKKETPKTFGHEAFPINEETEARLVGTSPWILKGTHAGVKLGITATGLSGEGTVKNRETTEAFAYGEGPSVLEGVTVTEPAGKGCKVKGGSFTSNKLETTTLKQGVFMLFKPVTGSVIAEFMVEGCSVASLNTTYKLEGSFKGAPSGSTITLVHSESTAQGTLTLGGLAAGLELVTDVEARKNPAQPWKKLSTT
jgi:hypothetical protein